MPWMWIVAGPNGAGKSTFTTAFLHGSPAIRKLNADELTAAMRRVDPLASQDRLNLAAAKVIDQKVEQYIREQQHFLVETVLSSDKYRDDVDAALKAGFQLGLIYISVHPPELSPARVAERVLKGGHAVEREKAIARYHRSHAQLAWFAGRADILMVYDNSAADGQPVLIASKTAAALSYYHPGLNPAVDAALGKAFPDIF